jgi:hypothetical protein
MSATTLPAAIPISGEELRVSGVPRLIFISTGVLFVAGIAAAAAWSSTGDIRWLHLFFNYPGSLFLLGCGSLELWLGFRCWRQFSPGDLLRPAWLLITISALLQLSAAVPIRSSSEWSELSGPLYMVFLACGLFYVLRACRQIGVLGQLKTVDFVLLGVVLLYTLIFFVTVVFSPQHGGRTVGPHAIISWTSDPLLCVLLLEAILIRRSAANLGWGLVSRCWMCFTVAIFLTSVGDIGLWASSKGYLPHFLEVASWYTWFLASAAYALGPAYQSQAMLRAMRGHVG